MSSNITVQRICQHCDKEFTAKTTVTRYCSDTCAKRAYKLRRRNEKLKISIAETTRIKVKPIEELKSKEFLSINELCTLVGISRRTVYRLLDKGDLSKIKIGSRTIIKRSELDNLLVQPIPEEREEIEVSVNDYTDCYTMKEIQSKYGISEKALHDLIKRNSIPKVKSGWYSYVPKSPIDSLFSKSP
jgi:excisionase family DNA binding protein